MDSSRAKRNILRPFLCVDSQDGALPFFPGLAVALSLRNVRLYIQNTELVHHQIWPQIHVSRQDVFVFVDGPHHFHGQKHLHEDFHGHAASFDRDCDKHLDSASLFLRSSSSVFANDNLHQVTTFVTLNPTVTATETDTLTSTVRTLHFRHSTSANRIARTQSQRLRQ